MTAHDPCQADVTDEGFLGDPDGSRWRPKLMLDQGFDQVIDWIDAIFDAMRTEPLEPVRLGCRDR